MRTMLLELRPDSLVEAPLTVLLDYLVETLTSRTAIDVSTDYDGNYELPLDVKINVYRIVQESINNISRHAQANRVQLSLRADEEWLRIEVRDDGCGFDTTAVKPGHMGVNIMRERAAQIGGELQIESMQGKGTSVLLRWQDSGEGSE
jgi:signal transduction histidine kinase